LAKNNSANETRPLLARPVSLPRPSRVGHRPIDRLHRATLDLCHSSVIDDWRHTECEQNRDALRGFTTLIYLHSHSSKMRESNKTATHCEGSIQIWYFSFNSDFSFRFSCERLGGFLDRTKNEHESRSPPHSNLNMNMNLHINKEDHDFNLITLGTRSTNQSKI
jgi:hypothetical protein